MAESAPHRVLFVASEVHPYIKVGGLADVAAGLPAALTSLGHDMRVLVPVTAGALRAVEAHPPLAVHLLPSLPGARLLELPLAESPARVWLLDTPGFRERRGTPYQDEHGKSYTDDAERFNELARAAALIGAGALPWIPDVVHCNEWHTGLVPVQLLLGRVRAATVFTVHNLGYQGIFPAATLARLGLPEWLLHPAAMGFHGQINFMQAGLTFADRLTAVSPRYAEEIRAPAFGMGLETLLQRRSADLCGVLNGVDLEGWNPETDPALAATFDAQELEARTPNREALCRDFGITARSGLLLGMVSRLVPQKGIDVLLQALPALMPLPVQLVVLGSGDAEYQAALAAAAHRYAGRLALHVGHDEALAHRIYAGCDAFLMPSRFEPCGLSQLYAMRYGAPPIAHRTGGLADTILDGQRVPPEQATGFLFDALAPAALVAAVKRAVKLHTQPTAWRRMMQAGMRQDFSWKRSARDYARLYADAAAAPRWTSR